MCGCRGKYFILIQTTTQYSQHAADFESFPKGIVGNVAQKF